MIKCVCNNITQKTIEDMAEVDGLTKEEAMSRLGVGSQCGQCREEEEHTHDDSE